VVRTPLSSKFPTESTGEKIVKISQYLAKIWRKYNGLFFWPTLYIVNKRQCLTHFDLVSDGVDVDGL